jgi:hypothetical protein
LCGPGVDLEFDQPAIGLQELDFIEPQAVVLLKLHLQNLSWVALFQAVQNLAQWPDLARLNRVSGPLVIVVVVCPNRRARHGDAQDGSSQALDPQGFSGVHVAIIALAMLNLR